MRWIKVSITPGAEIEYNKGMMKPFWILAQNSSENDPDDNPDTGLLEKVEVKEPSLYKVLLVNDDFTPMDFVIHVLQKFFNKSPEDSQRIMLDVHQNGQGLAGIYSFEVAETKVFLTNNLSKQNKYPLKCIMEKE